jgi:uncharacterized protein (DUF849 family)
MIESAYSANIRVGLEDICYRGADNHSPASKNTNLLASLARVSFFTLADPFYIFGQLFSDLASKNTELLARVASVLKNLSTPLLLSWI